jgi:hypothetical protein
MTDHKDSTTALHEMAHAAFDRGCLAEASSAFGKLLAIEPENRSYRYMQGLTHKYLLDWPASLKHNLAAIALNDKIGEAEHWNAAIAATALGEWAQVRALWHAVGIGLPEGTGPIVGDFGVAVVRLHPWNGGETVWMRRIDPVRARLLNVPLPESGHRFGDIVLHDGASTGFRWDGEYKVHVFNELQRLEPSDFATHVVFVHSPRAEDLDALRNATAPGIGYVEDWTDSVRHLCLRCSYGVPHRHDAPLINDDWSPHRNLGIAAQSRKSVMKLLEDWQKAGEGRHVDGVETHECAVPAREDGHVWWRDPNEDQDPDEDGASEAPTG